MCYVFFFDCFFVILTKSPSESHVSHVTRVSVSLHVLSIKVLLTVMHIKPYSIHPPKRGRDPTVPHTHRAQSERRTVDGGGGARAGRSAPAPARPGSGSAGSRRVAEGAGVRDPIREARKV